MIRLIFAILLGITLGITCANLLHDWRVDPNIPNEVIIDA